MAITDKKTGVWGLDQVYNKVNQGSIWPVPGSVADNHTFWGWGADADGQLAQNTNENNNSGYSSPVQVPGTNWVDVGGIKNDGTLWAWGLNYQGALGLNNTVRYSSPVQVGSDTTWKASYRPDYLYASSMAVKNDGTLWAWGNNQYGQLGQNSLTKYSSPVQVGTDTTWPKVKSERKFGFSNTSIYSSPLVIKTDGTLWAWGYNISGVLGQNQPYSTSASSPVQIGTGTDWDNVGLMSGSHRIASAIKTDGTLWTWGKYAYGQLGHNNATYYSSPTQIPGTTWKALSATTNSCIATKTDGTLWSWGNATSGQLGTGQNNVQRSSPCQIGTDTTWDLPIQSSDRTGSAIKTDGTLWKWGLNTTGQLGQNDVETTNSPVQIPGTDWSKVESMAYGTSNWILKTI